MLLASSGCLPRGPISLDWPWRHTAGDCSAGGEIPVTSPPSMFHPVPTRPVFTPWLCDDPPRGVPGTVAANRPDERSLDKREQPPSESELADRRAGVRSTSARSSTASDSQGTTTSPTRRRQLLQSVGRIRRRRGRSADRSALALLRGHVAGFVRIPRIGRHGGNPNSHEFGYTWSRPRCGPSRSPIALAMLASMDPAKHCSWPRSPELMSADDTGLLVVDVQEKLIRLLPEHARIVWNIRRLLDGAKLFGLPVLATRAISARIGRRRLPNWPSGFGRELPRKRRSVAPLARRSPANWSGCRCTNGSSSASKRMFACCKR